MLNIKVVIHGAQGQEPIDEIDFDLILPGGITKSLTMDTYALKQYRGASISDIIRHQATTFAEDNGYTTDDIQLEYMRS